MCVDMCTRVYMTESASRLCEGIYHPQAVTDEALGNKQTGEVIQNSCVCTDAENRLLWPTTSSHTHTLAHAHTHKYAKTHTFAAPLVKFVAEEISAVCVVPN